MKLYDFDGMFEEKLADYIRRNPRGYTEKQWEDVIPALYAKFGDTVIKSIGKTPNEYYGGQSDGELLSTLLAHIAKGVPVSEFLCSAIEKRNMEDALIPLLDGGEDEATYALNLLGANKKALPVYMRLVCGDAGEDVRNTCMDYLKERADDVRAQAVENYKKGVCPEYMLEILSRTTPGDDEVFSILLSAFRTADDKLPERAGYIASYGDERALPFLMEKIEDEDISFVEFRELKYAIEALGGSYEKERDFSSDPYYDLIKSHGALDIDIFKDIK